MSNLTDVLSAIYEPEEPQKLAAWYDKTHGAEATAGLVSLAPAAYAIGHGIKPTFQEEPSHVTSRS